MWELSESQLKTMPAPKNLRPEHKEIADAWMDNGGNGRRAVMEVRPDLTPGSAEVKAARVLGSDKVQEYLKGRAERAAVRVVELSEQDDHRPTALNASKDILDRAGYKPVEKTQSLNLNIEVKSDPKSQAIADKYEEELKKSILSHD